LLLAFSLPVPQAAAEVERVAAERLRELQLRLAEPVPLASIAPEEAILSALRTECTVCCALSIPFFPPLPV